MKRPRIRLRVLMIAIAVCALLLGWLQRQDRLIGAPDIIDVQVQPALPGRPISGTRLIRPDGTVSLGYYGRVHVAGLTPEEVERRIAAHLRQHCGDEPQRVSVRIATKNSPPGLVGKIVQYAHRRLAAW